MKIRIWLCISISFLLCSCASSYKRDTSKGKIQVITLAELQEKVNGKQTFLVMLTQSLCGYCQQFEAILDEYISDHYIVMYNVVLDKEQATPKENLAIIKPIFPDFTTTPGVFYVKNGKEESHLLSKNKKLDETILNDWVQTYKLDEGGGKSE